MVFRRCVRLVEKSFVWYFWDRHHILHSFIIQQNPSPITLIFIELIITFNRSYKWKVFHNKFSQSYAFFVNIPGSQCRSIKLWNKDRCFSIRSRLVEEMKKNYMKYSGIIDERPQSSDYIFSDSHMTESSRAILIHTNSK